MKASEIRKKFCDFFISNSHLKHPSSPLIPIDDPTLLFANAGMNQFKDYFTGKANAKDKRAVTVQKVVRAGGKHNDLENVGFTARHHTFFEMLGNFSFGDYFKSEAIDFAWKFLTEELKIPKDKLYITVHDSDDEAEELWIKEQGIPKERIFRMGDKDNFWEMGDTGPCGPCSEIFYDHGPDYTDPNLPKDSKCLLEDEMRYVEIWNLVFMQFEKYIEGGEIKRRNLPKPSVDTGAGLERIAALMQGKYWNYDSDLFSPIFNKLEELSGKKYSDEKYTSNMRVAADHARSAVMLITDGAIPSNEGRGYVLRRIIRRAIRHLRELGLKEISFYKLIPAVFESLGEEYPENAKNASLAEKLLKVEEKKFLETLDTGMKYLEEAIRNDLKNNTLPGEIAFKLYDTFGFPYDLTEVILRERNLSLDQDGFDQAMKKQKELSKKAGKFTVQDDNKEVFYSYKESHGDTKFLGYDSESSQAKLLGIEKVGDNFALLFDQTPFYGESGGQAGDNGNVFLDGNQIAIIADTQKPVDGIHAHITKDAGTLEVGETYELRVDSVTRALTMRNHSATHLLQSALINVMGDHIKQSGSAVDPERLRFDFTNPEGLKKEEIEKVEKLVNEQIALGLSVAPEEMSKDDAMKKGAMALFGEKYGDQVRVVTMGDFSVELCGGTHVKNTNEIGYFSIISESALSSGVRRIEALTSSAAINRLKSRSDVLSNLETEFSVKDSKVLKRVSALQSDIKNKNKEIEALKDQLQSMQSETLFANPEEIGSGFSYKVAEAPEGSDLRKLSDIFINKNPKGIILLYTKKGDKVSALLRTHKDNKEIQCSNLLKDGLALLNGRGGGKPDMAQGSGDYGDLTQFKETIKNGISKSL